MTNSKALDVLGLVISYLYRLAREDIEDASALRIAISGGEDMRRRLDKATTIIASQSKRHDFMLSLLPETKHFYLR
jgi:hypothetical protein